MDNFVDLIVLWVEWRTLYFMYHVKEISATIFNVSITKVFKSFKTYNKKAFKKDFSQRG